MLWVTDENPVKLDVEGFEKQALKGLEKTLGSLFPILLIEINNPQRWLIYLEAFGHGFYHYDKSIRKLGKCGDRTGVLNLFCLSRNSNSRITKIFEDNVKT